MTQTYLVEREKEQAMAVNLDKKRQQEMQVLRQMLGIYCRGQHHLREAGAELCPACQQLADYACARITHCPHMAEKTFCNVCPTHCYAPAKREAIREAMRYAGPRMLWHAPLLTLQHMFLQLRERWQR